jgi:hypothetical protein
MRLQSLAATNQARLLLGPPAVTRVDPPPFDPPIRMDDSQRSVAELIPAAEKIVGERGDQIAAGFLQERAAPYVPSPVPQV